MSGSKIFFSLTETGRDRYFECPVIDVEIMYWPGTTFAKINSPILSVATPFTNTESALRRTTLANGKFCFPSVILPLMYTLPKEHIAIHDKININGPAF